jgi:hypothetical protein
MKIGKSKIKKFLTQEIDDEKIEKFGRQNDFGRLAQRVPQIYIFW